MPLPYVINMAMICVRITPRGRCASLGWESRLGTGGPDPLVGQGTCVARFHCVCTRGQSWEDTRRRTTRETWGAANSPDDAGTGETSDTARTPRTHLHDPSNLLHMHELNLQIGEAVVCSLHEEAERRLPWCPALLALALTNQ